MSQMPCWPVDMPELHELASQTHPEDVLRHQLDCGADINSTNSLGETPLLALLRAELPPQHALVKQLLMARADVNCSDMMGETALMEAACLGDPTLILLLLQARAEVEQRHLDRHFLRKVSVFTSQPQDVFLNISIIGDPKVSVWISRCLTFWCQSLAAAYLTVKFLDEHNLLNPKPRPEETFKIRVLWTWLKLPTSRTLPSF